MNYMSLVVAFLVVFGVVSGVPSLALDSGEQTFTVVIDTYPKRLPLIIDGVLYVPGQSAIKMRWQAGTVHTVSLLETTHYTRVGERLVFDTWNTGERNAEITIVADANKSVIAIYRSEAYLKIISPYAKPSGAGWYPLGTEASIRAPSVVSLGDGLRAVFVSWSDGETPLSSNNTIVILEPTTVRAEWKLEAYINATSSVGAPVRGGGWKEIGETVLEAPEIVYDGNGTRYVFKYWRVTSGDAVIVEDPAKTRVTLRFDGPASVTAYYEAQYLVRALLGPLGTTEEYVSEGSSYQVSVSKTVVVTGPGERFVFQGWSNGAREPVTSITVTGPTTIEAIWKAQYKVEADGGPVPVNGTGWYWEGDTAVVEAPPTWKARAGISYVFRMWSGDASGSDPTLELVVDGPISVKAVYEKSYKTAAMGILVAGGVAAAVLVGVPIAKKKTGLLSS
ncbi:MAG: hypothetical protein F7C34_05190 [Desulfurococcales archaeon]|nr:hypothetical protein [Desulfurococcales archaeon]